jgi:hypothetical protein
MFGGSQRTLKSRRAKDAGSRRRYRRARVRATGTDAEARRGGERERAGNRERQKRYRELLRLQRSERALCGHQGGHPVVDGCTTDFLNRIQDDFP